VSVDYFMNQRPLVVNIKLLSH